MQMIFQDPYASLNPRMRIGDAIAHPLLLHDLATRKEAREIALKMLKRVGLTPENEFYERLPHQLSGGQRQRVVIARAMVLKPEFVVADEPVSMIDVSMRASILDLLQEFKKEYGLTMLFITHDIAIGRIIANKLAVMYLGKIVEVGPVDKVINKPLHPYTLALIESVPSIRRRKWVSYCITYSHSRIKACIGILEYHLHSTPKHSKLVFTKLYYILPIKQDLP